MRALAIVMVSALPARAEVDDRPSRVPLTPLPAAWKVLDVGPCEKAANVPCAVAPFQRVRYYPPSGRSVEGPARIVFAGPGGATTQALGPPFDGRDALVFDKAPLGHLAMSSDYLMFLPRNEPRYDPRLVAPGPRGWQWAWGDPKAPRMPEEVALAVAGERDFPYVVHRDPRTGHLDYYEHPAELRPPPVPLRATDRVIALAVEAAGLLHALVLDGTRIVYVTNRRDDVREAVADAGDPGTIRAAIAADARGGAHAAYRDSATGGVEYWTNPKGTWARVLVAKGEGLGERLGAAVDGAGVPHLVCSAPEGLVYATWGNGAWVRHAVTTDGPVAGCAIASEGNGETHIVAADGKRGLLRYASNGQAPDGR
ncbi:MAG: hypothetical protein L6Q95_05670 [Planctomycetes bacterium]|nr:hypothetical protein [Planctomycetota bacterium]